MNANKTKVLLCAPFRGGVGGIKRWTEHILNYYEDNKNDIDVEIDLFDTGRKHFVYGNTSKLKRVITGAVDYLSLIRAFRKRLATNNYDVVHITTSASFGLLGDIAFLKKLQKRHIRSVVHFHFGRIPQLVKDRNWEYKLLQRVIHLSTTAIVLDEASYHSLLDLGYDNIKILPNPLAPKVEEIIASHQEITKIDRSLVFVGHVVRGKGVYELIEACKGIPNIHLKVIGTVSSTTKQELLSVAGHNNENWLEICGEKEYEDVIKEMISASIFVLPTYSEGFPNVILEAMACGCAIIASSVGAIPEMLDVNSENVCGLTIAPKQVDELKDTIEKMLDNVFLATNCGQNAMSRVRKEYTIPQVMRQLIEIWKL
ncbi:glycosyltransferase family 4 protein [Porphyromonas levii]|uniref:glycosyltransferase family 4 protein n=1 Tax=Porphyromonas levii TaxID=28114 RepID=UPI001B8BC588|nr:glycosyltransferase family 4 protein [Porphyromonas levii]MBR8759086.1 D-inositol-3-phosphate glycosyltransferase [Porphyromonas levii]